MRVDLYRLVHKAQRFHLFQLGSRLSHADWSDELQRRQFAKDIRHIVEVLREHAANEARYIHPLFAAESLDAAHHQLEAQLTELEAIVTSERWSELYSAFMRFLGEYLLHIDAEERAQTEHLWPRYSDAELMTVMQRFRAERPPEKTAADARFMIPALNAAELTGFLQMR